MGPENPRPSSDRPPLPQRVGVGRRASSDQKTWLVVGLVIVVGLGALVTLVAALVLFWQYSSREVPVTAEDRAQVLDIQALAEWVDDFSPRLEFENLTKTEYFDRTSELAYEYDSPEGVDAFYLSYTIHRERRRTDALALYGSLWAGTQAGFMLADGDVGVSERNDLFQWGDKSRFGLITVDGAEIGNLFVGMKGQTVVHVLFSGVYFDEATSLSELLTPPLDLSIAE